MTKTNQKRGVIQRLNHWLNEPDGAIFKSGKWRFWLPMLIVFSLLNTILTAMIFGNAAIMVSVGALLAWLCIGTLHYSDSPDSRMARGVAAFDSFTLLFVIAHFAFLFWIQSHVWTLQSREADYKASAIAYNDKAERLSDNNVKIAEANANAAKETSKAERLRNDTAYQLRRAAETGKVERSKISQGFANQSTAMASTNPIELERPDKPKESSTDFLTKWDKIIRLLNFGELALAAFTFIYIRNRSAKNNAGKNPVQRSDDEFPSEFDGDVSIEDTPRKTNHSTRVETQPKTGRKVSTRVETQTTRVETQADGLQRLRAYLKEISFYHPGNSFKVDVKTDYVWIRMMASENGREETISSTKSALSILDDVIEMTPDAFKARLIKFLKTKGFPIETAT